MKKKNKRQKKKYPNLDPSVNLRSRYDAMDIDYLHKLSAKEKDWLNRFNAEFVNANFKHKGKRIHPQTLKKKKIKKTGKMREVDLERQQCEHNNNARNRCVLTKAKASKLLYYNGSGDTGPTIFIDGESEMIKKLDSKKLKKDVD